MIPLRDMYYPFELFYYIFPFSYYMRSMMYLMFKYETFEPCIDDPTSAVCTPETDGLDVLDAFSRILPLAEAENTFGVDLLVIIAIGLFYKLFYIIGVIYFAGKASKFHESKKG